MQVVFHISSVEVSLNGAFMNRYILLYIFVFQLFEFHAIAQVTMAEVATKAGINIGIATNGRDVNGNNAAYKTLAKDQFNMVVCENEMKFQPSEPSRGKFNYSGGDQVYTFANANGMKMRGHNFLWHSQSGWASTYNGSRTEMLSIMKTHIDSVGGHFKTKILEWDVLNEITSDGGGGLRNSFWQTRVGDDYPDSAFVYANRVIGNNGFLYYNDYGAEGLNSKSNSIYALAKRLVTAKIPIDGIGLQCHLSKGLNAKDISSNIKRLGELGLRVSMTEIDIKNGTSQDWTNLLNACLENYNCVSFVTWGLDDAISWLGSNCDCLLYDGQLKPKAHVQAMIDAFGKADPEVVKKRLEFSKGGVVSIAYPHQITRRPLTGDPQGVSPLSIFSIRVGGQYDVLGRNPVQPVLHALNLQVLSK
jgi:endo-1,4-beta-xylanase